MRIGELLDKHHTVVASDAFKARFDVVLDPKMIEAELQQALKDAIDAGRVDMADVNPDSLVPTLDNVKFYTIGIDRCHVALLRDLPEARSCPKAVPARSDLGKHWVCVGLSAKGNRIRKMANLCPPLQHLHSLDLSVNHITAIEGLEHAKSLTSLSLHHNGITTIGGLGALRKLLRLDLGFNKVAEMGRALSPLRSLTELNVSGNKLESLAGLSHLPSLTRLDAYANQLSDIRPVVYVAETLVRLNLADNRIEDLEATRGVVLALTRLTELSFQGNAICSVRDYRMELMAPQLRTLDTVRITPQLRDHVRRLRTEADLNLLGKATTEQYLAMIDAEEARKERSVGTLKERESEFHAAFTAYRSQMQREMQECLEYVETLKSKADISWTVTGDTIDSWKSLLSSAETARREVAIETKDEDLSPEELTARIHKRLLQGLRHGHETSIETHADLRTELLALARNNPQKWRAVKILDLGLKARAESAVHRHRTRDALVEGLGARPRSGVGAGSGGDDTDDATTARDAVRDEGFKSLFAAQYSRFGAQLDSTAPAGGAGAMAGAGRGAGAGAGRRSGNRGEYDWGDDDETASEAGTTARSGPHTSRSRSPRR